MNQNSRLPLLVVGVICCSFLLLVLYGNWPSGPRPLFQMQVESDFMPGPDHFRPVSPEIDDSGDIAIIDRHYNVAAVLIGQDVTKEVTIHCASIDAAFVVVKFDEGTAAYRIPNVADTLFVLSHDDVVPCQIEIKKNGVKSAYASWNQLRKRSWLQAFISEMEKNPADKLRRYLEERVDPGRDRKIAWPPHF